MIIEARPSQYEATYFDGTFQGAKEVMEWLIQRRQDFRAIFRQEGRIILERNPSIDGPRCTIPPEAWVVLEGSKVEYYCPEEFKKHFREVADVVLESP